MEVRKSNESKQNKKKNHLTDTTVKLKNSKIKETILKTAKEKRQITFKEVTLQVIS